ncbi:uncharacterized protein DUF1707 [Rhodococcus sp. SMB37]|nr:uncharacterized protein DUF1707 [Rhodococcus sp. SMB37]
MDSPEIRIGDTERAQALNLLGEHFSHGRLNLSEFEERSAQATAATTRGELEILFTDLPAVAANAPDAVQEKDTASGTLGHWREIVMGLTPLLALVLFFAFDTWLWFLLVPAVSIVLYAGRSDDEDDVDDKPEKKN